MAQPIPARLRPRGIRGGTSFQFTWTGGRVVQQVDAATQAAMDEQAQRIAGRLHAELHRYPQHATHQLADEAFAQVELRGGRRTLVAGSDAPYTVYHELGTVNFGGHPQIRQIMDQEIPQVLPRIRSKLGTR